MPPDRERFSYTNNFVITQSFIKNQMQSNITLSYSAPFEAKAVKSEIDRLRAEATRIKIDADAFPKTSITKLNQLALEFT